LTGATCEETLNIHIAATTLHYGQEIFEGLKAFRGADGKIRIFRLEENARRLRESAEGLLMEPVPEDLFREMCIRAVKLNEYLVPPYGSGASLYIRPLEIGLTPRIGVKTSDEYLFMVMVTPVGPYFKTGSTVWLRAAQAASNAAATMQLPSRQVKWPTTRVTRLFYSSTPWKRNISTSAARPTSSL